MAPPRLSYPINDVSDFRAWKQQNPNAEKLLFRIIFRWRVSSARLRSQPGKWVANPIDFWVDEAKLSRDQTKRALATLELDGLIIRGRGWFAGSKVHPFLRPTPLALKHMGRPGDIDRLNASLTPMTAPNPASAAAQSGALTDAPTSAPTITSPSLPSNPPPLSKPSNAHSHALTTGTEVLGGKIKLEQATENGSSSQESEDIEMLIAAEKLKSKESKAMKLLPKLLEAYPIKQGAHAKQVKHPYELHGWKWATWSFGLIAKSYETYSSFVENWYAGKKGKAFKPYSYDDAEIVFDFDSIPDVEELWLAKDAALKAKKAKKA